MQRIEIEITDDMIQRFIREDVCLVGADEDGEPVRRPLDLRSIVTEQVRKRADAAIALAIGDGLRAQLEERIAAALDEGFQPLTRWGDPDGERVSLKSTVAAALQERGGYDRKSVRDLVIEQAKREVEVQVKAMVAEARAKIDADVAAAAADALKAIMRKHLGLAAT